MHNFAGLKRFLSILILAIYLVSATEMQQLLKLPVLLEHYTEHKQLDNKMSLWQFLCMHYANGNEKDADYDKDMKLPFKTHTETVNLLLFFGDTPSFFVTPHVYEYALPRQFVHRPDEFFDAAYAAAIWQPPRAC